MKLKLKTYTKLIIITSSMISIALTLFIAFNANRYIVRMSANNSELYDAYKISELMKSFRSNITVLEAKQRGYLITGDGKFLEEYKQKETETKTYLKSMEKYFSGKPEEENFYALKDMTYRQLLQGKDLSHNSSQEMNPDGTPKQLQSGDGIKTMSEISATIDTIEKSLGETTKVLIDHSVEYVNASKNWGYLEILIGILAALTAVLILFRDVNTRNKLEKELRLAKKNAEENAQMKEFFMSNMSHEIRTPMNAIVGFSNLLEKTKLDETQSEYLEAIRSSGSNLLNIINDILDFSKIEAGKLSIEKIPFNIFELIDSVRLIFSEKVAEKKIDFEITIDPNTPPLIFGDPTRLTQIFINLVGNAIKFTSHGKVSLNCEVKGIEHDMVHFVFTVKDTGIGIPTNKQDEIFDRFNQGSSGTSRKYGGTGLGLSIVKSLVEIQNGTIHLKSKEGTGTEFVIHMSYPISYETIEAPRISTVLKFPEPAGKPMRILLADDNTLNQKLAKTFLNGFGLSVEVAENGLQALEKLKTEKFDLVLMDIQMPVLDGYLASQKIREELQLSLPVIAMTAHTFPGEREKCIRFGMTDYISKPFKEQELFDLLSTHLRFKTEAVQSPAVPVSVARTGNSVINMDDLYALTRGNTKFLVEMIEIFLQQIPLDLVEMTRGIKETDFETLRALSHRMKTSLGFMGMQHLLPQLDLIERLAEKKEDMNALTAAFALVKTDCEKALVELTSLLEKTKTENNLS